MSVEKLMTCPKVYVMYFDFSNAFDKVELGFIYQNIQLLGIIGIMGKSLHGFLKHRSQALMTNEALSKETLREGGVTQRTVSGWYCPW